MPAYWDEWGEWGEWSMTCGGLAVRTKARTCQAPADGGEACPSQTDNPDLYLDEESQATPACWNEWMEWEACQGVCGDASQTRTRTCIPPEDGGLACPTESETESRECNTAGMPTQ